MFLQTTVVTMVSLSIVTPGGRITPAIRDSNDRRVLKAISTQLVRTAVWRRNLPAELGTWLADQEPDGFLELGLVARPKVLLDELRQAADAVGISNGDERQLFLTDVWELARDFASIARVANVEVRLKVATEACLHVEGLAEDGLKMLSAYHVAACARPGSASEGRASEWQLPGGGTLLDLERFSVVMLKGRRRGAEWKAEIIQDPACVRPSRPRRLLYLLEIRA